jgi:hypothetical protein
MSGHRLELIAQSIIVAPLEAAFLPLPFAGFDQVLQAAGALRGWFAAFGATPVSLHAQLVLPLAGNRQLRELVLNRSSHFLVVLTCYFVQSIDLRNCIAAQKTPHLPTDWVCFTIILHVPHKCQLF